MTLPENIRDQFGKVATVANPDPNMHASWTGTIIGYRDHPCVTLEFENGDRICLPADWVVPADA